MPVAPIVETQIGAEAYLWGITNDGTAIAITGIATFETDSDEVTQTWDETAKKDGTGHTRTYIQTNFRKERSITFDPTGATRAAAAAIADAVLALANLVISHYKVAAMNGTYRIKPGTKLSLKQGDNASISITGEKFDNATQNSDLTGSAISG